MKKILDTKFKKANIKEITSKFNYLNSDEHVLIYILLRKHENMFGSTLGNYKFIEGAQPYYAKLFFYFKNNSEWVAPTFIIPKKDGTNCFISDFREFNKRIKRKPFPIPKVQKLGGFKCASSSDLNLASK